MDLSYVEHSPDGWKYATKTLIQQGNEKYSRRIRISNMADSKFQGNDQQL
jgi:hypothetical protein